MDPPRTSSSRGAAAWFRVSTTAASSKALRYSSPAPPPRADKSLMHRPRRCLPSSCSGGSWRASSRRTCSMRVVRRSCSASDVVRMSRRPGAGSARESHGDAAMRWHVLISVFMAAANSEYARARVSSHLVARRSRRESKSTRNVPRNPIRPPRRAGSQCKPLVTHAPGVLRACGSGWTVARAHAARRKVAPPLTGGEREAQQGLR